MEQNNHPPVAVLVVGPCRSGTTWVQALLTDDATASYFQPFKHAVRCHIFLQSPDLSIRTDARRIVIKEALGPYFLDEICYDPVARFDAVLPDHDRRVIFCMDDPQNCFLSWCRSFRRVSEDHLWLMFREAYRESRRLWQRLHAQHRLVLPFTLTAYEGGPSAAAMTQALLGFAGGAQLGGTFRAIQKVRDPAFFEVPGLLDEAKKGRALALKARLAAAPSDSFNEMYDIYAEFIATHTQALGAA